jgi:hypothetical protein
VRFFVRRFIGPIACASRCVTTVLKPFIGLITALAECGVRRW